MQRTLLLLPFLAIWAIMSCSAQPQDNASDFVPPMTLGFGYGSNMGVYPPYIDETLAILLHGSPDGKVPGVGVTTIRPALPENFLNQWGYDIRLDAFKLYDSIGLKDLTVFVGFPSEQHRDPVQYCPEGPSESFKNMYADIWDGGANGTPVNDTNHYALYIYKLATTYKGLIRYYEVMNEPDLDLKGNAWKPSDMPGNWWKNNPQPCEYKFRAPAQHYVRMLRITYEVVKSIDPAAFVAIGGVGYPAFLDVVCRNSDNPNNGTLTSKFPYKGGAYFDVLSYHAYPHIDNSLREWDIPSHGFKYYRHSDRAIDGVFKQRDAFKSVLLQHGYNGNTYPEKHWIITEINIPRRQYGDFIGSDAAQVNFMMKALIMGQVEGIDQMCIYNLADETKEKDAVNEFSFMGLFRNLTNETVYQPTKNQVAIGFHTTSLLLKGYRFNKTATTALQLPAHIRGGVFTHPSSATKNIYALWAKTDSDQNEINTTHFTFPLGAQVEYVYQRNWDYSTTGTSILVNARDVVLTATPTFFEASTVTDLEFSKDLKVFPNPLSDSSNQLTLNFYNYEDQLIDLDVFDTKGRLVQQLANQQLFVRGGHQLLVNLALQAKGTYFIRLRTAGGIQTVPLVRS